MKQTTLIVTENTRLADGIYRLRLAGDTSAITAPGQFVNLKLSGFFLRRPISVCDWENGELTLIYKVLGHGTEAMTGMAVGTELDVLTGLGNGFDVSRGGDDGVVHLNAAEDHFCVHHTISSFSSTGPSLQMRLLPYFVSQEQPMQAPKPQPIRSSKLNWPEVLQASYTALSIGSGPQV